MDIARLFRHWLSTGWQVRRAFPRSSLDDIEQAIKASEMAHSGEIRVAIEDALPTAALWRDRTARARAIDIFAQLRVWDTEQRNGVLIYVLLADRDIEIVADRGVNGRVTDTEWAGVCRDIEQAFQRGDFHQGVIDAINAVTALLVRQFPVAPGGTGPGNELPDRPVIL